MKEIPWGLPGVEHLPAPLPVLLPTNAVEEHGARAYADRAIYYSNSGAESSQFANQKLKQPVLFIAGEHDAVIGPLMFQQQLDAMEQSCPGLTKQVILEGAGHWVQLERREECLRHILEFEAEVWQGR